ncbi:unnamed protein product [Anisakis simplex]|uniref:Rap-GAP domain-containing protein n=1 Tax=Anisakis simplex TaxID=6269 RepID=A0A0M3J508_ANISI|nr:unnamed protein product [Anisakis simplex]
MNIGDVNSNSSEGNDSNGDKILKLAQEAHDVLIAFMRYGKMGDGCESSTTSLESGKDNLSEQKVEHWIVNDSIISIAIYTEGNGKTKFTTATASESDPSVLKTSTNTQNSNDYITDVRRRHQSAVHRPERCCKLTAHPQVIASEDIFSFFLIYNLKYVTPYPYQTMKQIPPRPAALDDSYAISKSSPRTQSAATVTWTQIVVRHVFGKQSWLMRSLSSIPEDFDAEFHDLCTCNSQWYVMIYFLSCRTFRNLDRISALEMHTVGVVYVGYGQTKESEILANVYGSERYANFIR